MNAPRPDNEAERLAVLRSLDILDTAPEQAFDELAALTASICQAPVALIGLLGYGALFVIALVRGEAARAAGVALAVSALLLGGYLLVVQVAVIHAICIWCVASDVIVALIALLTLARAYAATRHGAALAAPG